MSKSRSLISICVCILLILSYFPKFILGFHLDSCSLSTNKSSYYIYEYIEINAEWELYYDVENEVSFIQIQIYDDPHDLIWNSYNYSDTGFHSETWNIYIPDIDLNLINDSTQLYVKFYFFFDDKVKMVSEFKKTVNITILNSELSCELIGFKNSIIFGETTNFSVIFYETGNNSVLINQTVFLKVKYNDTWIFSREFVTEIKGEIDVNLSSIYELNIGENELNFIINDSIIYEPIQFSYAITVNRIPIIVNIIQYEEDELISEVSIKLRYYYHFKGDVLSLSNTTIFIRIFQNNSLKKEYYNRTNLNGTLLTKIIYNSLYLNSKLSDFNIQFIFNGTIYLENSTTNFLIKMDDLDQAEKLNSTSIQIISFSGFITSMMIFSVIIINKNRSKEKSLSDLYVKA